MGYWDNLRQPACGILIISFLTPPPPPPTHMNSLNHHIFLYAMNVLNIIICGQYVVNMWSICGFMPGKGTTDVIMRQVQAKHQAKKNNLYYAFWSPKRGGKMAFVEVEAGCG